MTSPTAFDVEADDFDGVSRRRRWTLEEDDALVDAVQTLGPQKWGRIARTISERTATGTRNASQCRERWYDHLSPDLCKAPWTEEEDIIIELGVASFGRCWSKIATMLGRRSSHAIRNRYSLLSRVERPKMQPSVDIVTTSKTFEVHTRFDTDTYSRADDPSLGSEASPVERAAFALAAPLAAFDARFGAMAASGNLGMLMPCGAPLAIGAESLQPKLEHALTPQLLVVPCEKLNSLMDDWIAASLDSILAGNVPPPSMDSDMDTAGLPTMAYVHAIAHAQAAELATMSSPLLGLERAAQLQQPRLIPQATAYLPASYHHSLAIPPFAFSSPRQSHALPMHVAATTPLWASHGMPMTATPQVLLAQVQLPTVAHPTVAHRARVVEQPSHLPGAHKSNHVMQMPNTIAITRRTFSQPTADSLTGVVRLAPAPWRGRQVRLARLADSISAARPVVSQPEPWRSG